MSAKTDEILEQLKTLSLLEASELVKQIEEAFGVDASASSGGGMMMMAPGLMAGAGAPAEPEEEQTEFDVVLEDVPADKKIAILKVVRSLTGLGLRLDTKKVYILVWFYKFMLILAFIFPFFFIRCKKKPTFKLCYFLFLYFV